MSKVPAFDEPFPDGKKIEVFKGAQCDHKNLLFSCTSGKDCVVQSKEHPVQTVSVSNPFSHIHCSEHVVDKTKTHVKCSYNDSKTKFSGSTLNDMLEACRPP